jgi:ribonuclease Z
MGLLLQITNTVTVPEIAFTGDTMSDFIVDQNNIDVLRSRILVMEVHFITY